MFKLVDEENKAGWLPHFKLKGVACNPALNWYAVNVGMGHRLFVVAENDDGLDQIWAMYLEKRRFPPLLELMGDREAFMINVEECWIRPFREYAEGQLRVSRGEKL